MENPRKSHEKSPNHDDIFIHWHFFRRTLRIRALGARRIQQVAIGRVSTNSSEPEAGAPSDVIVNPLVYKAS